MDSATLMQQLKDTQAGTPDAATLYNTAVNKYGIPEIRGTVAGLRTTLANTSSAINNVTPSVAARSQGSLVTGGQQARLANLERAPLDTALATENTALGNASSDLNSKLGEATNEANLGYKAGQDKISGLKDLLTVATNREQAQRDEAYRQQQAAEAKANADRAFAESQRQFNATPHGKSGGSTKTAKSDPVASLNEDITANVKDFRGKPNFWTERTLVPQLVAAYPELTPDEITKRVYAIRKQYE